MLFIQPIKNTLKLIFTTTLSITITAQAIAKDFSIIDQAPQNTDLIIITPSLVDLDLKTAKLLTQLGIPDAIAQMGVPVQISSLTQIIGLANQKPELQNILKNQFQVMITFSDIAASVKNDTPPTTIWYFQTDNPEELKEQLFGNDTPEQIKTLKNMLIYSSNTKAIQSLKPANLSKKIITKLGKQGSGELNNNDISVIFPNTNDQLRKALNEIDTNDERLSGLMPALIQKTKDLDINISPIKEFLKNTILQTQQDTKAGIFGIQITDQGIQQSATLQIKPNTLTTKILTPHSKTSGKINNIPTQNYIHTAAIDLTQFNFSQIITSAKKAIEEEAKIYNAKNKEDKQRNLKIELFKKIIAIKNLPTRITETIYAPRNGQTHLHDVSTIHFSTSQNAKDVFKSINNLLALTATPETKKTKIKDIDHNHEIAVANEQDQQIHNGGHDHPQSDSPPIMNFKPNAITVNGITFNQTIAFAPDLGDNAHLMMASPMFAMFTPKNEFYYTANTGNTILIITTNQELDQTTLKQILANHNKNKKKNTPPAITATRKNLDQNPTAEYFLDFNGIFDFINPFIGQAMQFQINLPPETKPLGFTFKVNPNSITQKTFISTESLTNITKAYLDGMQQMMQRMQQEMMQRMQQQDLQDEVQEQHKH